MQPALGLDPRFGVQTPTSRPRDGARAQGTQPLRVPAHRAPSARTHSHPPPLGPGAGKRLPDPDLGSASAPCGRPAPDPAGLRRQKRPAEGPGRKLEPRGREGGRSASRAWRGPAGARATLGRRAKARAHSSPPTWPAARGPTWKGRRRKEGGWRAGPPLPEPRPAPAPRPQRVSRASRAGPGRGVPAAPGPLARLPCPRRPPRDAAAPLLSLSFSLRFPPPSPEEKTNKEEQIAGRRSASRTLPSPAPPPNPIQVGSSIFSGVARERPRGAGGGPRSEGRSREPCRADPGGPHSRRRRRRRRVGWKGREPPPLPPPPPGWAPFAVDAGGPGRAGPHLPPPPPPLPRRARPAKVAAGRGPGASRATGAGGGRAGRAFPLPGRAPAGTTSSSPAAAANPARPPASPARLSRPGRTFRVGRTQKKKFRRRGWRGRAPGGGDSARRSDSRAAAIASSSLSSAAPDRPARPRGSAFLSLPGALPSAPGQAGPGRARSGARRGPSPAGEARGVAGRPLPTQRPGAGRPRARELGAVTASRVETHTRTRSLRWLRFPPPPMVSDTESGVWGPRAPGNPIVPPRLTAGRLPGPCTTLCCGEGNAGAWVKANPPYLAARYLEGGVVCGCPAPNVPRQPGCWALLEGRGLLASGVRRSPVRGPSPSRPPTRGLSRALPSPRPAPRPPPPAGTWKEPGEDAGHRGGPRPCERGSEQKQVSR
ncbi:hypothetical protein ABFV05_018422 [Capra hircus]